MPRNCWEWLGQRLIISNVSTNIVKPSFFFTNKPWYFKLVQKLEFYNTMYSYDLHVWMSQYVHCKSLSVFPFLISVYMICKSKLLYISYVHVYQDPSSCPNQIPGVDLKEIQNTNSEGLNDPFHKRIEMKLCALSDRFLSF